MSEAKKPAPAEAPKEGAAAPAPAAGGGKMIGLAAGVMVLMLGAGFALTYFVLPGKLVAGLQAEMQAAADAAAAEAGGGHGAAADAHGASGKDDGHGAPAKADSHGAPAKDDGHGAPAKDDGHGAPAKDDGHGGAPAKDDGHGGAPKAPAVPETFEVKDVIVNVAGSRTGRFVRVSLAFDAPPEVRTELTQQRARVIDAVSGLLALKPEEELRAPTARGVLRSEIVTAVNALLESGQVKGVFFLEYLIQP